MAALFWPFWFSKLAQEALHRERERRVFTRMCTCVYVCLQTRCSDVRKAVPVGLRPPALLLTSCGAVTTSKSASRLSTKALSCRRWSARIPGPAGPHTAGGSRSRGLRVSQALKASQESGQVVRRGLTALVRGGLASAVPATERTGWRAAPTLGSSTLPSVGHVRTQRADGLLERRPRSPGALGLPLGQALTPTAREPLLVRVGVGGRFSQPGPRRAHRRGSSHGAGGRGFPRFVPSDHLCLSAHALGVSTSSSFYDSVRHAEVVWNAVCPSGKDMCTPHARVIGQSLSNT